MAESEDEDWVRRHLASAPPATNRDTPAIHRLQAVHTLAAQSRRRRQYVSGATAATLLVLGCGSAFGVQQLIDDGRQAGTANSPVGCATETRSTPDLADLPKSPVSVIGCWTSVEIPDQVTSPKPVVTMDLDRLVATINRGPVASPAKECVGDEGATLTLIFKYPNDRLVKVRASLDGCDRVRIGDSPSSENERGNATEVALTYQSLLKAQRASSRPPDATRSLPTCPSPLGKEPSVAEPADFAEAKIAEICIYKGTKIDHSVEISSTDVATLVTSYQDPTQRGSSSSIPEVCVESDYSMRIYAITDWDDEVTLVSSLPMSNLTEPACYQFLTFDPDEPSFWTPNEATAKLLARISGIGA